jgi:hypothetical protein
MFMLRALILFCLLFSCNAALADVYKYIDSKGNVHITNAPSSPQCKQYGCTLMAEEPVAPKASVVVPDSNKPVTPKAVALPDTEETVAPKTVVAPKPEVSINPRVVPLPNSKEYVAPKVSVGVPDSKESVTPKSIVAPDPKDSITPKVAVLHNPKEPVAPKKAIPPTDADKKIVQTNNKPKETKNIPEEGVKNLVNKWLISWKSSDMKTYESCYASDFKSKGRNLDTWVTQKNNANKKSTNINISIDQLQISVKENNATAEFTQYYSSSILNYTVKKKLELRKINDEWKIYREILSP